MGAVAAASLCAVDAMAQISYNNGDMMAGFRDPSASQNNSQEVIVDLGSISLYQAQNGLSFTPNSSLATALTTTYGSNLSGLYWSVFGFNDTTLPTYNHSVVQGDPYTLWTTIARRNNNVRSGNPYFGASSASQQLASTDMRQVINSLGQPGVSAFASGIDIVPSAAGGYTAVMNSSSPNAGDLNGDWLDIERTGSGVSDLYQFEPDPGANYLGNFSLDASGDLAFNAVPEPSTWVMLGTGLMTLIAIRRSRRN